MVFLMSISIKRLQFVINGPPKLSLHSCKSIPGVPQPKPTRGDEGEMLRDGIF